VTLTLTRHRWKAQRLAAAFPTGATYLGLCGGVSHRMRKIYRRSTKIQGVGGTAVTWNPGTCHVAGRVPQMSTPLRCVDLRNAVDLLETSTSAMGRDGHQRHQLVTSGPCSASEKGWPLDLLLALRTGVYIVYPKPKSEEATKIWSAALHHKRWL